MNLDGDAVTRRAKEFHENFHQNNSEVRHDRGFRFVVCGNASVGAGAGGSGGGYSGRRRFIDPLLQPIEMDRQERGETKPRFASCESKTGQKTRKKTAGDAGVERGRNSETGVRKLSAARGLPGGIARQPQRRVELCVREIECDRGTRGNGY